MKRDPRHKSQRTERSKPRLPTSAPTFVCEADVPPGLEHIAQEEIEQRFRRSAKLWPATAKRPTPGAVRFDYSGDLRALLRLQTVQAVYLIRHFAVPRPRALLGDQHFRALLDQINVARKLHPPDTFQTLYTGAAGAESSIMLRLKEELAQHTGLVAASHEGDLLLRLRRPLYTDEGWEALVRLSPRPLATRDWRVCNWGGALNAAVARAMALLTHPTPHDFFLNLACGSGTLLIERLACAPAQRMIGCDTSSEALECARANLEASGHKFLVELEQWDAQSLPLPSQSVDALCADLPFGNLVGSHTTNIQLYPRILREAARVAKTGSRFVVVSHEVRLMDQVLAQTTDWSVEQTLRIRLGGLHPRVFVLQRA
jgi:tRNA (guanine6-N2)-methyltransferase